MSFRHHHPAELLRDHARPRNTPAPTDATIRARLTEIIAPATYALTEQYRRLGLRERVLTLPVMACLLVALVWRQVPAVSMLAELLDREQLFWTPPRRVSQQALNARLRTLPPDLFRQVVHRILPQLATRAAARSRPRPDVIEAALSRFSHVWAVDATTLEALFKKAGVLRGVPQTVFAGKLLGVLDIATKLPVELLWDDDPAINERSLLDRLEATLPVDTLLLLDRGFFGFALFDRLQAAGNFFIMPDRQTSRFEVVRALPNSKDVRDQIIAMGQYRSNPCRYPLRRIELTVAGKSYAYLTNVLDPERLSAAQVVDLYRRRWRIEEAFLLTKRLLGLSYLWTGAINGIQLQVWTTWLLYAILVDLCDEIADILDLPLDRISIEMVFRSLYFYVAAASRGKTSDPAAYLADPAQASLGIVKRPRPPSAFDMALRALS